MNALLRDLHPVFADICAGITGASSVIARATVPEPESEPEGCESCAELRAHYLTHVLCNRCARQARRDHEAGL